MAPESDAVIDDFFDDVGLFLHAFIGPTNAKVYPTLNSIGLLFPGLPAQVDAAGNYQEREYPEDVVFDIGPNFL